MSKFADACRAGTASYKDVDDYIEAWHTGDSEEPLHDFLGLTREEYAAFVQDPKTLASTLDQADPGVSPDNLNQL
jgi:hypothetical protein